MPTIITIIINISVIISTTIVVVVVIVTSVWHGSATPTNVIIGDRNDNNN